MLPLPLIWWLTINEGKRVHQITRSTKESWNQEQSTINKNINTTKEQLLQLDKFVLPKYPSKKGFIHCFFNNIKEEHFCSLRGACNWARQSQGPNPVRMSTRASSISWTRGPQSPIHGPEPVHSPLGTGATQAACEAPIWASGMHVSESFLSPPLLLLVCRARNVGDCSPRPWIVFTLIQAYALLRNHQSEIRQGSHGRKFCQEGELF